MAVYMVCVCMGVHLPGPGTAGIVSGLTGESGHLGAFVRCAMGRVSWLACLLGGFSRCSMT